MKSALGMTVFALAFLGFVCPAASAGPQPGAEEQLWEQAQALQLDYEQRCTIIEDHRLSEGLNKTLRRLWPHVHTDLAPMALRAVQDPIPNALTSPNGVCYITTGMVAQLRNEDQLAMVLAHETVHYVRRHAFNAMRHPRAAASAEPEAPMLSYSGRAVFSRQQAEKEADAEGLHLIRSAGYDAVRIIALLNGFEPLAIGNSTSKYRRSMISAIIESAPDQADTDQSYRYDPEYLSMVSPALLANARAAVQTGLWDQAEHHLSNYLSVRPDDPGAYHLLGEAQRRNTSGAKVQLAIRAYETAIRLDREFAPAYRELGVVYLKMGQRQRARQFFQTYLALTPRDEGSDYVRGYLSLCGN